MNGLFIYAFQGTPDMYSHDSKSLATALKVNLILLLLLYTILNFSYPTFYLYLYIDFTATLLTSKLTLDRK